MQQRACCGPQRASAHLLASAGACFAGESLLLKVRRTKELSVLGEAPLRSVQLLLAGCATEACAQAAALAREEGKSSPPILSHSLAPNSREVH